MLEQLAHRCASPISTSTRNGRGLRARTHTRYISKIELHQWTCAFYNDSCYDTKNNTMFMQKQDANGVLEEEFSRPVESIMRIEDFKSNFARRLSNRYTSKSPVATPRQDTALKLRPEKDSSDSVSSALHFKFFVSQIFFCVRIGRCQARCTVYLAFEFFVLV